MSNASLEERLGYRFQDPELLEKALTHSSYLHEHELEVDNERLEFLGDAVLQLAVSIALFQAQPDADEGGLTRCRVELVKQETLARLAESICLGVHLKLGQGEMKQGGNQKPSILSDALEAVFGAIYLDGGKDRAFFAISHLFSQLGSDVFSRNIAADPKLELQMLVEQRRLGQLRYETKWVGGSDHNPIFEAEVFIGDRGYGVGRAASKKKAQVQAAKVTLLNLL